MKQYAIHTGKYSSLSGWLQSAFFKKINFRLQLCIRATIVAFQPQRVNPYFGWCVLSAYNYICLPKYGLNLVELLENVLQLCMNVASYPATIIFDQTHVVSTR